MGEQTCGHCGEKRFLCEFAVILAPEDGSRVYARGIFCATCRDAFRITGGEVFIRET